MVKASINIVTVRKGGIDWQLKLLAKQTFTDFEVVLVDAYYEERKDYIELLAHDLGLVVKHLPSARLNYITEINHSSNRNEALVNSDGEIIIFFDDYQLPSPNFVETHVKECRKGRVVAGRQRAFYFNEEREYDKGFFDYPPEEYEHNDAREEAGYSNVETDVRSLWTNNASVCYSDLVKVGGFDERYNGGTGGEDGDLGVRLHALGNILYFTVDCEVWHIEHHGVDSRSTLDNIPSTVDRSLCNHDRAPFTCNQYQQGDMNLMSSGSLITFRDVTGIKYYLCKNCGCIGCIDSIEILNHNAGANPIPPDMVRNGIHTYVPIRIPKSELGKVASIYEGTQFTYYRDLL